MLGGAAAQSIGTPMDAEPREDGHKTASTIARRPNLILFMPDELRADSLACYGNTVTKTPNFDKLASQGTRFENCHVQYPVCGASRCSLLTGWPTSVRGHRSLMYFLRPDEPNMFRILRRAGYDVFWYGKNDALAAQSFYDSVTEWNYPSVIGGGSNLHRLAGSAHEKSDKSRTFISEIGGDRRDTNDYSHVKAAINILNRKEADRPFCIFLPLTSPHPPYGAPEGFHDMYRAADIQGLLPKNLPKRPIYMEAIRKAYGIDTLPEATLRKIRALYYGMVSYSDWLLGELLEAIEKNNHTNDTAVFVLSDHGDYAGDYGLVEKWPSGLENALTHVPVISRIPGGKENHSAHGMIELFDVMATCLELAGTRAAHTNFARSLMPQVRGGDGDPDRAAFAEGGYNVYEPQCFNIDNEDPDALYFPKEQLSIRHPETITRSAMVQTREYKLVSRPQGQSELYFFKDDPHALNNRYGEASAAAAQTEMQQRLLYWYQQTTGIAPNDKDQRGLPPYSPTPDFSTELAMAKGLDRT